MLPNWTTRIPGLRRMVSRRDRRAARTLLRVESLEARDVPAATAITWDGGGGDFNWSTAANWSSDVVPGAEDDVAIGGAVIVELSSSVTVAALQITGGATLALSEDLTVTGQTRLEASYNTTGTVRGVGDGVELHADGGVYLQAGVTLDHLTLQIPAGAMATVLANVDILNGTRVENAGTLVLGGGSGLYDDGTGTLVNAAAGRIEADSYYQYFGFLRFATLDNAGTIHARVDTHLSLGGVGQRVHNAGTISGDAGSVIDFADGLEQEATGRVETAGTATFYHTGNQTIAGSYSAAGTVVYGDLTVAFTGAVERLGDLSVTAATVDLTGAAFGPAGRTLAALTISGGGTLVADESLTVTGQTRLVESYGVTGTVRGVGDGVELVAAGGLYLQSSAAFDHLTVVIPAETQAEVAAGILWVRDSSILNAGNLIWTGGSVQFYGDSTFTNAAGARFDIQVDNTFGSFDSDHHCIRFENAGLLVKTAGTGVTTLNAILYNSGTVRVEQGIIRLTCGYVQQNFDPIPPGVDPGVPGPGDGEIGDPVDLGPTDTPVFHNYTQTVSGVLVEQIADHIPPDVYGIPGTDYGQIIVTGDVSLDGSLQVHLLNGFVPTIGDKFLVIDNRGSNPIDGKFTGLEQGDTIADGVYNFTISYTGGDGNDLVLTYAGRSVLQVQIDVRSTVNLAGNGVIAVALFSSTDFDARLVDIGSVRFAGATAVQSSLQDVNGDGLLDLVLNCRTQDTTLRALYEQLLADDVNADGVLDSSHQEATISLTGNTTDDDLFEGSDTLDLFLSGKALRDMLANLAASGMI